MNRRFAILSALLRYPDATLRADLPDIAAAIPAAGFGSAQERALLRLARRLGAGEPLDREEEYVRLFDRGRSTSLHLFEHVHGDTRNRGPAMLELAAVYEAAGLALTASELPDYLPLMLEFLAVAPPETASNLLTQAAPILDALHARLMGRGRPTARGYAAIIAATLAEAGVTPKASVTAEDEREDEDDLAALDAAYEDAPVVFGPEADPDKEGTRARIGAMIDRLRRARTNATSLKET